MDKKIYTYPFRERLSGIERVSWDSDGKPSIKTKTRNPKKGYGHIRKKVIETELNHFIEKYKGQYSVQKMCEVPTIPKKRSI